MPKTRQSPLDKARAAMARAKSKMSRDKVFEKYGYEIYRQVLNEVEFNQWLHADMGENVEARHWSDGRKRKDKRGK